MPRRARIRSLLTVAAAIGCLGLQLNSALHHLLVTHVHCAEHGELTHRSSSDAHAQQSASRADDDDSAHTEHSLRLRARSASGGELSHEHCPAAERRRGLSDPQIVEATAAGIAHTALVTPLRAAPHSASPLTAAPKTSPPA